MCFYEVKLEQSTYFLFGHPHKNLSQVHILINIRRTQAFSIAPFLVISYQIRKVVNSLWKTSPPYQQYVILLILSPASFSSFVLISNIFILHFRLQMFSDFHMELLLCIIWTSFNKFKFNCLYPDANSACSMSFTS